MPNSHGFSQIFPCQIPMAKWLLLQAELLGKSQDLHRLPSQRRRPRGLVQVAVDPALGLAVAEPGAEATAHAGLHLEISASEQKSHGKVGEIMENPIENWKNHGFFYKSNSPEMEMSKIRWNLRFLAETQGERKRERKKH